jgi:hypothetical protein
VALNSAYLALDSVSEALDANANTVSSMAEQKDCQSSMPRTSGK